MKNLRFICLLLIGSFVSVQAQAPAQLKRTWTLDTDQSQMTYTGTHLLHKWSGTNQKVVGLLKTENDNVTTIAVSAKVADFDSGNENRDAHALELLEVFDHPNVRFLATESVRDGANIMFDGNLQFRGVTLPLSCTLSIDATTSVIVITGTLTVKPTLFAMPLPSFLLKDIDDALVVEVALYFVPQ